MPRFFFSIMLLVVLFSCSSNVPEPETPKVVQNTGKMLSLDGGDTHIAYEYDNLGRVVYAERFDYWWDTHKYISEYRYDKDCIYIVHRQYKELPEGGYDSNDRNNVFHKDTLFLVDGRVDSCAGARQDGNRFFFKFRYNERGELTYARNENVNPKYKKNPWYTEQHTFEWQDGNIIQRTCFIPNGIPETTVNTYSYSSLTGSLVMSDPRHVLHDFEALVANGYFGTACRNLLQDVESSEGYKMQYDYQLDEQQQVWKMVTIRPINDEIIHTMEYLIKWDVAKL